MAWIPGRKKRVEKRTQREKPHAEMYHTTAWKQLREAHRTSEPLCRECAKHGVIRPMSDVDHIVPHRGDWVRFMDADNLQSLCKKCHNEKTGRGE